MTTPVDVDALVQPDRVHRRIYTDPEIFRLEMERVFGATWTFLTHESLIPEPFDFVSSVIGQRPLIITRGDDGEIRALVNRCAHRASTVCQETCGNAKRFTCGYHGWTYGHDGRLVGLPFPKGYPDSFDKDEHGLRRLPRVESYRGWVFGSLNPAVGPLTDFLAPVRGYLDYVIDRAPGGCIEFTNHQVQTHVGNWKLFWDNAGDGLHASFSHRSFALLNEARHGEGRSLSQFLSKPDDLGMYGEALEHGHLFVDQRPGLTQSFWKAQRPLPGADHVETTVVDARGDDASAMLDVAAGSMINLGIFPTLTIGQNLVGFVRPRSVDHTDVYLYALRAPRADDAVNVLRMRGAEDFSTLGTPDDFEIFRRCWSGLQVSELEWIDMSKGIETETVFEREGCEVRRDQVTYDTTMRGYLREWARLMRAEPPLVLE